LQEVATRVWPEKCVSSVEVLLGPPIWRRPRIRKFEKIEGKLQSFNSMESGMTIAVGGRAGGVGLIQWSWRDRIKQTFSNSVLNHPDQVKEMDDDHIELSNKLPWVLLRKGARNFNVDMDMDGWVRLSDIIGLEILNYPSSAKLFAAVQWANSQKVRYQMKRVALGHGQFEVFIRAVSKSEQVVTPSSSKSTTVTQNGSASHIPSATESPIPPARDAYRAAPWWSSSSAYNQVTEDSSPAQHQMNAWPSKKQPNTSASSPMSSSSWLIDGSRKGVGKLAQQPHYI